MTVGIPLLKWMSSTNRWPSTKARTYTLWNIRKVQTPKSLLGKLLKKWTIKRNKSKSGKKWRLRRREGVRHSKGIFSKSKVSSSRFKRKLVKISCSRYHGNSNSQRLAPKSQIRNRHPLFHNGISNHKRMPWTMKMKVAKNMREIVVNKLKAE